MIIIVRSSLHAFSIIVMYGRCQTRILSAAVSVGHGRAWYSWVQEFIGTYSYRSTKKMLDGRRACSRSLCPSIKTLLFKVSTTMAAAMAVLVSIKDNYLVEDSITPLLLCGSMFSNNF
jgi:hypothetical protein